MYGREKMDHKFCWNCYNFEDRRDIEGVVRCDKGHTPGTTCKDFVAREDKFIEISYNSCWNCCNFEDRRDIEGVVVCYKRHRPKTNCDDYRLNGKMYLYCFKWKNLLARVPMEKRGEIRLRL